VTAQQEEQTSRRPWWRFWQRRPAAGGGTAPRSQPGKVSTVYAVEGTAVAGGLVATIVYAAAGSKTSWSVMSASVMIAVAALGSGALIGILFGVPRTTTGNGQAGAPAIGSVGANTNLEQISDWLTKIIVGVGLTQFAAIKREGTQLFHSLAPALGDGNGRASFAGSVVIYFFVVGFLSGWLYARLRLGLLMSTTDALLELARRADRSGDTETAQTAREQANNQLASATVTTTPQSGTTGLILQYERLSTTPAGTARDAAMSDIVRQAGALRLTERFTPLDVTHLFNQGSEGSRIVALALMEGDTGLADFASALNAIQAARSDFEQYHALTVASLMLPLLSADNRAQLRQALESDVVRSKWETDSRRAALAATILDRLRPPFS
jgi:hypothetical protein